MSLQLNIRRKPQAWSKYQQRLHRAQEAAQTGSARAAERIGPAAQRAKEVASHRITDARAWSAPRLERTAHYVETELGPRIGTLLHTTAHKVKPARTRNKRRIMAVALLVCGGVASTVGALARRRKDAGSSGTHGRDVPADAEAMSDNGQVRTG
ncbi:MAG TPA: hypothetical protein VF069_24200 [Streptosporangiaceae bacterium]